MARDGEVLALEVTRFGRMSEARCHCCFIECAAVATHIDKAIAKLPCNIDLMELAIDSERVRNDQIRDRRRKPSAHSQADSLS